MATAMIALLGGLPQSNERNDDDISDRMNHRFTVSMLLIMSLVITTKQYVGDRISCWHPAHFSDSWSAYTDSYCWVKDTYRLPFEDHIPKPHEYEKRDRLTYYQWVPIILLSQAFFFYFPIIFWRSLNDRSGVDTNNIIETAEKFNETGVQSSKDSHLSYMTEHMHRYLQSRKINAKKDCVVGLTAGLTRIFFCCGRGTGTYLIPIYFVTKLLFLANSVGQLLLLNVLLGTDYHLYGFRWLAAKIQEEDFGPSYVFPRVTMCDVYVRRLGNLHRYTMQCVLPINLFNELVFLIIWFWIVGVSLATLLSLFSWMGRTISRRERHNYVRKHLSLIKAERATGQGVDWDKEKLAGFVDKYLMADGVFLVRLIHHNTNSLTAVEFLDALYKKYHAGKAKDNAVMQPV